MKTGIKQFTDSIGNALYLYDEGRISKVELVNRIFELANRATGSDWYNEEESK